MKNLLVFLFGLTFCIILSVSIFAGNRKIHRLGSISNDSDQRTFTMSTVISKDSGKIETIHIDSYDGDHLLERQSFDVKSLQQQKASDKTSQETATENPASRRTALSRAERIPPSVPAKKPVFQTLNTEIKQAERIGFYGEKVSVALELSPRGDIETIHFDMYQGNPRYYDGRHRTKRIPIKDFFEKTFESPQVYAGTDKKISPISFHPLDFNPKDGGTFAIRFKNRHFFKSFSTSKEVVMSLIKDGGKWILADEGGRPINKLWIQILSPRVVRKIVADAYTPTQRKLKIRPCEKSARSLLH